MSQSHDLSDGMTNPLILAKLPDPGILAAGDTFYLYSTNTPAARMPVYSSPDLVTWRDEGDAMPDVAPWAMPGRHWAPEVIQLDDGTFAAYYTARRNGLDEQAVSVAVATSPTGPFVDQGDEALLTCSAEGGCIDASPFRDDDGSLWLVWKNDGNHIGTVSHLYLSRLAPDGRSLVGEARRLVSIDQPYESYTIEGPTIVKVEGTYYLLYSTGEFWNGTYSVCVAAAPQLFGPWTKSTDNPLLVSNEVASGPGHGMPIKVGAQWWYVYHAWRPDDHDAGRQPWLSRLDFGEGTARIAAPSLTLAERPRP